MPVDLDALRANAAYNAADRGRVTYGELVCVCAVPDADLHRDAGMCHNPGCFRKPLALMAVAS